MTSHIPHVCAAIVAVSYLRHIIEGLDALHVTTEGLHRLQLLRVILNGLNVLHVKVLHRLQVRHVMHICNAIIDLTLSVKDIMPILHNVTSVRPV